ncbi:hypothetical protein RhiirA5_400273 [Rhizophagus irregularis]|uniref:Uncharacterized protein n=1 Tax=Rhizophagus irregularis TaxID=588596 RepID=A0A2N0PIJ0_9GLOM|nr:hypothetical protein RhiirA5_400273 [Rhizophagus irregularis]
MSETQFSWSQFPQYTEEQLKRASKSFKSSVNWAKYKEWVEAGKPFKEHNELLSIDQADQKLENSSYNRPVDKENKEMDLALTKVSGRPTESLGKEAMTFLPLTELKPPLVTRKFETDDNLFNDQESKLPNHNKPIFICDYPTSSIIELIYYEANRKQHERSYNILSLGNYPLNVKYTQHSKKNLPVYKIPDKYKVETVLGDF